MNVPVCLSRLFPVGEETSSFVHDVHGLREERSLGRFQNKRSARACRLRASHFSSSAHFARWIFSRRTTESLQTRPPCSPMTKTSHMKTKFNPAQRHHRSLTELVAQKFTYSQSRMSPVAARCECDCVIESTSRRALMRISTSVTFQNTVFVLEETRRGRGRARRR